jgi:hypothetical protein
VQRADGHRRQPGHSARRDNSLTSRL